MIENHKKYQKKEKNKKINNINMIKFLKHYNIIKESKLSLYTAPENHRF